MTFSISHRFRSTCHFRYGFPFLFAVSIFLSVQLVFCDPISAQQASLKTFTGTVTDVRTGRPLTDVNVYLSGTTEGAATDNSGRYHFSTSQTGSRYLVASFVGYKVKRYRVVLDSKPSYSYDFELDENVFELDEVRVTRSNRKWKRHYAQFEKFFLGTDYFAEETMIKNPEVLNFSLGRNSSEIIVTASEALIVTNEALGYHMKIELEEVRFNASNNTGFYTFYPVFAPMKSSDEERLRYWEENRQSAYEGSSRHFFRSLFSDQLRSNNFDFYPGWGLEESVPKKAENVLSSMGTTRLREHFKVYKIVSRQVMVGHHLGFRLSDRDSNLNEVSFLMSNEGQNFFLINSRGQLFNPVSIIVTGRWARDRLAKALPLDYTHEP